MGLNLFRREHWGLGREFTDVVTGHFIDVPAQLVTIDEAAQFRYKVKSLTGITLVGSVDVDVLLNGVILGGLGNVTVGTTQVAAIASPLVEVTLGDRLELALDPTGAEDFSWTLAYRRLSA